MARSNFAPRAAGSFWPWIGWAVFILIIDQLTKTLILGAYRLGDATPITGFFSIVRAHNTGAAFSFLAQAGGWQRWLFTGFALSSILGGAIGNVVDRLLHGYVVDFLDFHWAGSHFPAFNVADSAITLGAICLVLDELLRVRRAR